MAKMVKKFKRTPCEHCEGKVRYARNIWGTPQLTLECYAIMGIDPTPGSSWSNQDPNEVPVPCRGTCVLGVRPPEAARTAWVPGEYYTEVEREEDDDE